MRLIKKLLIALLTAFAISAVPAGAATQLGSTAGTPANCPANSVMFVDSAPYIVPSYGVITQMSLKAGAAGSFSFKVVRRSSLDIVAGTPVQSIVAGQTLPVATRFPVRAGDEIGLWNATQLSACPNTGSASDAFAWKTGFTTDPGLVNLDPATGLSGHRLNVSATLEPDADGDGFGDESQDACPTAPTRQASPCVCKVPNVKAKTKSQAKAKIEAAGCKLGKTKKKKLKHFTKKQKRNRVRSQNRPAGDTLAYGAIIDITINVKK